MLKQNLFEMDSDWQDFLKLLSDIGQGKGIGVFAPSKTKNEDPKTWEEMIERINELPGDEPITWQQNK